MAGPYYIASDVPKRRLVLRRNPNYGGDRPARFARSTSTSTSRPRARRASVEAGRADYTRRRPAGPHRRARPALRPRSAAARAGRQRYFSGTRRPALLRVQHAPAALRRHADAPGGQRGARPPRARRARARPRPGAPGRPTDQFIPPGLPGSATRRSTRSAARPGGARRLAGSDRRRRGGALHVQLPRLPRAGARGRAATSRRSGSTSRSRPFPRDEMFAACSARGAMGHRLRQLVHRLRRSFGLLRRISATRTARTPVLPRRAAARRIRAALRLTASPRRRASRGSTPTARAAAAAPFATAVTTDFFSDRIGCQVHQPLYGISLGALCVRR